MSDTVFMGGAVYTAHKENRHAEAVAVKDGKISYVGTEAGAKALIGPGTEVVDLKGRLLMPAFFEAHCHFSAASTTVVGVNLAGGSTEADYVAACKKYLAQHPGTTFLRGQGYLEAAFPDPNNGPRRQALDEVSRDIPIVLFAESLHTLWANTKAIEMAGVTADTPDPPHGRVDREPDGAARGCFREAAQDLIIKTLPDLTVEEYKAGILAYQAMAHRLGLVGAYDAWLDEVSRNAILALRQLDAEGKLKMRLRGSYWMNPLRGPEQVDDCVAWRREDDAGNLFRIGSVKFFLDGIVESFTSLFLEPYVHAPGYPPGWLGDRIWDDENLLATYAAADKAGLYGHFHCYGDGATRQALDTIQRLQASGGRRDARPGLTHLFYVNEADFARFAPLGVAAVPNPYWAQVDETTFINGHTLGMEREAHTFPIGSFFKHGAVVAGASDYPITAVPSPFIGIEMGVTRTAPDNYHPWVFDYDDPRFRQPLWPEECAGVEDMIDAFTYGAAWTHFADDVTGSIQVGKSADLVVASQNILAIPAEDIATTQPDGTMFQGEWVYRR